MPGLIINFKSLSDLEFLAKVRLILTSLRNHPSLGKEWPSYVPSLDKLEAGVNTFQNAFEAAAYHDSQKVVLKNEARKAVDADIKKIAKHVELAVGDDIAALQITGFDLRREAIKVKQVTAVAAPHLLVRHGEISTTMIGRANRVPGAQQYVLQSTETDPTVEENWKTIDTYTKVSRIEITGLQPGKTYSFRMRAIGKSGPGPWSGLYTLMAL